MAKLLAHQNLTTISDQFLGLAKDAEDDRIICTYGRNLIIVMELSTQKQVITWSLDDKLLKRAVFDSETQKYVGQFGERSVRCWNVNDSNISTIKQNKLLRPIHEFVVLEDGRLLILYSSSYCESLKSALNGLNKKFTINEPNRPEMTLREVFQAKVVTGPNGKPVLSFFTRKQGDTEVLLSFVELDEKKLQPLRGYTRVKLSSVDPRDELAACTLIHSNQGLELVSICTDSNVFIRHLDFNNDDDDKPNSIGSFSSKMSMINPNKKVTLIALRNDYVVIYAANNNQDGASVLLYNTQLKIIQSRQSFKVFLPETRMFIIDNCIYLTVGKNLTMIPFRLTKKKLSSLIGSQKNQNQIENYVERDVIKECSAYEESLTYNESENATSRDVEEGFVYLQRQKKRNKRNQFATRTYEDPEAIEEKMRSLYKDEMSLEITDNPFLPHGDLGVRVLQNSKDSYQMHLQFEILAGKLERGGASEVEISERVLSLLLEAQATSDIIIALRRYLHISEKMITRVVKYAISLKADTEGTTTDLLNIALSCTFDTTFTSHLRTELSLDDTLFLLRHLKRIFQSPVPLLDERSDSDPYHNEDKQIIKWVNALLDSHFQQICISKDTDVLTVVNEWKKIIDSNVKAMQELHLLRASILKLAQGQDLTSNEQSCKFYSVELLKLY